MRFDQWQNSFGTIALTSNSTGHVSQPTKPIISGQIGSYGSQSAAQKVPFDDFWVQRGITYNSSTRRFVVPTTGIYRITFNAFQLNTAAGTRVMIGINDDAPNSANHRGMAYGGDANHQILNLDSVVSLNANDYIVFYISAGALYNASGDRFNQFSIEMIA